ncbi:MAG: hypothetical protein JOY71_13485 [Acetobacteraceae bacterium]|nr:hypothetical protein [Acetobacteraceae bacterium]
MTAQSAPAHSLTLAFVMVGIGMLIPVQIFYITLDVPREVSPGGLVFLASSVFHP